MAFPDKTVENVLPTLLDWLQSGQRVCLATLYHSLGSSPRPIGSQMAIAEDGSWFGYLSGGCAEKAIAEEGVAVINEARNRSVRYGLGSPYIDIQLPCGAGIDIWFNQTIQAPELENIIEHISARKLSALLCSTEQADSHPEVTLNPKDQLNAHSFRRWYTPARRLYLVGTGPALVALAMLATEADYQVCVLTPDEQAYSEIGDKVDQVSMLHSHSQIEELPSDPWTSLVLMFHEHDREIKILEHYIESDLAYIGALGSARTHQTRINQLINNGISKELCTRIHGPVGLQINAKTPMEIAISVLSELTLKTQEKALPLLDWGGAEVSI